MSRQQNRTRGTSQERSRTQAREQTQRLRTELELLADPETFLLAPSPGSLRTEPDADFPLFLEWMREDKFPMEKLVTNRYSLEQIEEARVALEEGQILGRAIIEF